MAWDGPGGVSSADDGRWMGAGTTGQAMGFHSVGWLVGVMDCRMDDEDDGWILRSLESR